MDCQTILLAEEQSAAASDAAWLEKHGYTVITAGSGEQAVAAALSASPQVDLVLMSAGLGAAGMDGIQAAGLILQQRTLPLIFLVAHPGHDLLEKTAGIPAAGFIARGSGEAILIASIRAAWRMFADRQLDQQKDAELQASQARTNALLEGIPDLIFRLDRQGVFLDYKADITDLYSQSASIIGKRNRDLTPPEFADLIDREIRLTLETGQMQIFEYQLPIPGRGLCQYEARMVPTGPDDVTTVVRDVTERKQAEFALEKALKEKQGLLKELQHRAKNSFAMITGMISLMESASQSSEARSALADAGSRVLALANLFELLSASDAVSEVALDTYCATVLTSLPFPPNIHIIQSYQPVTVPVKTAAPVGLILTELLTNAIKHAFPGGRPGIISVSLHQVPGRATLEVADDGIGIATQPPPAQGTSLGLTLVRALAAQIRGTFRVDSPGGTHCVVEFPIA